MKENKLKRYNVRACVCVCVYYEYHHFTCVSRMNYPFDYYCQRVITKRHHVYQYYLGHYTSSIRVLTHVTYMYVCTRISVLSG